jgi:transaldolase
VFIDLYLAPALQEDYIANGAAKLREAIDTDAETTRKLNDALLIFGDMEAKLKALIRAQLQTA